jgi:hypothetical protein
MEAYGGLAFFARIGGFLLPLTSLLLRQRQRSHWQSHCRRDSFLVVVIS